MSLQTRYNPLVGDVRWAKAHFFVAVALGGEAAIEDRRARSAPTAPGTLLVKAMAVDVERLRAMAERVVSSEGLYLVDVELKGGRSNPLLRIYIDKQGGISHSDCQLVSEQLSAMLDVEDPFPGAYTLEVSSPGLDRELRKPSDYEHFAGRRARLILRPSSDGQTSVPTIVEGRLAGLEAGRVRLDLGESGTREYDLAEISKAKLLIEM